MKNKNQKTLNSFIKYAKKNPEQRFWQALRNFSGYDFIYGYKYDGKAKILEALEKLGLEDTFYIE